MGLEIRRIWKNGDFILLRITVILVRGDTAAIAWTNRRNYIWNVHNMGPWKWIQGNLKMSSRGPLYAKHSLAILLEIGLKQICCMSNCVCTSDGNYLSQLLLASFLPGHYIILTRITPFRTPKVKVNNMDNINSGSCNLCGQVKTGVG